MLNTSKKMKRIERKKKKLEALIEISELNDKDRAEAESPQTNGPGGDNCGELDTVNSTPSETKKQVENMSELQADEVKTRENFEDFNISQDSFDARHTDEETIHRKSKKKRKSKHQDQEEIGDSEIKLNQKLKSDKRTPENDEDWPELSNSVIERKKRKSSVEIENQKERPVKMVKRQGEDYHNHSLSKSSESSSFADDLASFKKDLDRKKRKKEKRNRNTSMESPYTSKTQIESSNRIEEKSVEENQDSDHIEKEEREIAELKKLLKERKKQLKEIPMVRLKSVGKEADLELETERTPILPADVQQFVLLAQLGHDCPRFPRWVELKKFNRVCKTVMLVVEGASAYDFYSSESSCPNLSNMDVKAEMVSPFCYNASIVEELCAVPVTRQQKKELEKRFGKEICPEALLTDRIIKVLRSAFSISSIPKTISEEVEQKISVPNTDKFPRTELLLSAWQLIEEGYPLPYGNSELGNRYPDYVMTKEEYAEVTPSSPMWALDCEMCLTRVGNELTRVSVVNEKHETVYESFCLPPNPIINYLTEYSGITPEMLKGIKTKLDDIQRDLRELFPPDVILVGQSLNGDLHALKMMHPYIIDTSVIFNLTGVRRHKSKLKRLAEEFLKEAIQQRGAEGHDSVEDSLAALKLVQHKLTKSIEYGDAVLSGLTEATNNSSEPISANSSYAEHGAGDFKDLKVEVGPTMATSLFKHITMRKKAVTLIGQEEIQAEYSAFVAAAHRENKQLLRTQTTTSNTETIDLICRECKNTAFTMGHVVLYDDEDATTVDSWLKRIIDVPPFNSLFIVVFVGSHKNFSNGACFAKVKKPSLKLKSRKD